MTDDAPMTFPCKEEGCDRTVSYSRKTIFGAALLPKFTQRLRLKHVYLECDRNHRHVYEVQR